MKYKTGRINKYPKHEIKNKYNGIEEDIKSGVSLIAIISDERTLPRV
jgi:hypothetical protein